MSSFVRALSSLARRVPVATIAVVLVVTVVLGAFAGQAQQDQGQESFSPDNPALEASQFASEAFASSTATIVQVVVGSDGADVVSPEGLRTVDAIREAVLAAIPSEQLSAAQGTPVVTWLGPIGQSIAGGALDPTTLTDDAAVDAAYTDALAQLPPEQLGITERLVATGDGTVAATDASYGLALVFLDTEAVVGDAADDEAALAATNEVIGVVQEAVASIDAPLEASAFAFELLLAPDDTFTQEIGRLFGTAALVIVLILMSVFAFPPRGSTSRVAALRRAAADTGLTLFVIFASIGWMQGIGTLIGPEYLGWIGAFSPPTQIIPILLIGLGVDYGIHLTSRYREELAEGASVDRAVERASTTVGVALLLATMTTVIGFATNVTNPVPAIVDFGVLAAVGILVAFLLMLTFLPAARVLLDRRGARRGTLPVEALGGTSTGRLSRATESTAVLAERFAVPVVVVTVLLGGLGGYGLSQLSTEFSFADFVPAGNPVRATFLTIEEEFTGGFGEQTQVVLRGDVATPSVHNATVAGVASLAEVDGVLTVGDRAAADSIVARIGQQLQVAALADADPELAEPAPGQPPLDPAAIAAAATFGETATAAGLLPDVTVAEDADVAAIYAALLEADPTAAAVVAREGDDVVATQVVAQTQSGAVGAIALGEAVEDAFSSVVAVGPTVVATSSAIITDGIISDLSSSQVTSLILTLLAALTLLVAVFGIRDRRPVLGALTLLPVGLVVLWVFGMMAATGIPFGPVTSTMSGLAIGIGVPFTIHITNRFLEDLAEEDTVGHALRSTLRHTGGALVGSAFTTMAGFAVLTTSSLVPFRQLGLVVVYAIGFSLLAAVLVLPSLLAIWARRTGAVHETTAPAEA